MRTGEPRKPNLDTLQRGQDEAFGVGRVVTRLRDAERFLSRVGIALRYSPSKALPVASLYQAFGATGSDKASLRPAIVLTNQLLGEAHGIEVQVIAGRVPLVHRSLMPALYALVRRGRPASDVSTLSANARAALALLQEYKQVSAGDVRARLGARFRERDDPAHAALSELARDLLVDRGPFEIPKAGIPYLSTEGTPTTSSTRSMPTWPLRRAGTLSPRPRASCSRDTSAEPCSRGSRSSLVCSGPCCPPRRSKQHFRARSRRAPSPS